MLYACLALDEASCKVMSFVCSAQLTEFFELIVDVEDASLSPVCAETPLTLLTMSTHVSFVTRWLRRLGCTSLLMSNNVRSVVVGMWEGLCSGS